jgi:hypothetical protein
MLKQVSKDQQAADQKLAKEFAAILRNTAEDLETGFEDISSLTDGRGDVSVSINFHTLCERAGVDK